MPAFTNIEWWIAVCLLLPVILYFVLMVSFSVNWLSINKRKELRAKQSRPFAVIVAARNEEEGIESFVSHLLPQIVQDEGKLIVVDDASTDRTFEILSRLSAGSDYLEVYRNTEEEAASRPKQQALLKGIRQAGTSDLLFTDADCRPGVNWTSSMLAHLRMRNNKLVSGPVRIFGKGYLAAFQKMEQMTLACATCFGFSIGKPFLASGANLAYSREAFLNTGSYSNSLSASGDDVLVLKNISSAYPEQVSFVKDDQVIVDTPATRGLNNFFRQRIRWAAKNSRYKDKFSLLIGFLIFSSGLSMLISVVFPLFSGKFIPFPAFVWGIKILGDLILFSIVSPFFKQQKSVWILLAGQPFFVIYTLVISLAVPGGKFTWKERRLQ